jgi:predicted ATPase/DNA-binding NarL/FixJ family response regulator
MTIVDIRGGAPMFGRARKQTELLHALHDPSVRLVTLTGRGGVGKTRLALAVMPQFGVVPGRRVIGVGLGGVSGPELVLSEIAAAFGIAGVTSVNAEDAIAQRVRDEQVLLVLDNFEHSVGAAPVVSELLGRCPKMQILVTSQVVLRLRVEHVVVLDPLAVPMRETCDPAALLEFPSVAMYCARASAVDETFVLDESNAGAVAELCRQLEGLPLAIELAAARAATLPAAEFVQRYRETGIDLLRRPQGDVPARHHELRAAIDWTYNLLTADEQRMLRRLSVISGTFDIDAVEAMSFPLATADAIDQLTALVDVHLVDPVPGRDPVRFQIPSSICAFGRDELRRAGELPAVRGAHVAMRRQEALAAVRALDSADEPIWLERLHGDHDDLAAALEVALDDQGIDDAIDLACALLSLWSMRGYYAAEERLVERTLKSGNDAGRLSVGYANLLLWSARLGLQLGATADRAELLDRMRRGEALARTLDDTPTLLRALSFRTLNVTITADVAGAEAASREALDLAARTGEERWLGHIEAWSGMLANATGDEDQAIALGRSAVARARRSGDPRTLVLATMMLLPLRRKHPEISADVPPPEEALRAARAIRHTFYESLLLPMMVGNALADHDVRAALRWAAESLDLARTLPGSPIVGYNLMTMVSVAATCGDDDVAAYLHGAVREDLAVLMLTMAPQQIEAHEAILERSRARLGPQAFDDHAARGAQLTYAAALDEAIAYVGRASDACAAGDGTDASNEACVVGRLTERQQQVLALVVAGLGNREIADRLFISTKTAMHHTTAIYRALGVRGRAEAIAFAIRNGLTA